MGSTSNKHRIPAFNSSWDMLHPNQHQFFLGSISISFQKKNLWKIWKQNSESYFNYENTRKPKFPMEKTKKLCFILKSNPPLSQLIFLRSLQIYSVPNQQAYKDVFLLLSYSIGQGGCIQYHFLCKSQWTISLNKQNKKLCALLFPASIWI